MSGNACSHSRSREAWLAAMREACPWQTSCLGAALGEAAMASKQGGKRDLVKRKTATLYAERDRKGR